MNVSKRPKRIVGSFVSLAVEKHPCRKRISPVSHAAEQRLPTYLQGKARLQQVGRSNETLQKHTGSLWRQIEIVEYLVEALSLGSRHPQNDALLPTSGVTHMGRRPNDTNTQRKHNMHGCLAISPIARPPGQKSYMRDLPTESYCSKLQLTVRGQMVATPESFLTWERDLYVRF